MTHSRFTFAGTLFAALLAGSAHAELWTIENPNFNADAASWNTFGGTVAFQAINSPNDINAGGSALFTFSASSGSLTQPISISGTPIDTLTEHVLDQVSFDFAHDGSITNFVVGFYRTEAYDVFTGGAINLFNVADLATPPAADTDGTLDTFTTITVPVSASSFTTPIESAAPTRQILLFFGTSATGAYGSAAVGSKFAIDNIKVGTTASVGDWSLYGF